MAFRFVHTADLHLDSPLRSLALRDPELAELIGGATRRAFERIVDLCLAERVDALLIAGDLYDGEQTSMKTARFLADALRKLDAAGVRAFVIRGNHDAESRITRELTLPETTKVFTGRAEAETFSAGAIDVAIHGVSFAQKHAPESLLPKFRAPLPGRVNIGMLHTSLGGSPAHDRYAPCTEAELHGHGFAYWALGHVHQRAVYAGAATIVMPGNPQGRDINEAGAKSATLASVGDDGRVTIEERLTGVAEFARVRVDLTGVEDWRAALRVVETALQQARAAAPSEHLVARLQVGGGTQLDWRLRADADKLLEDAAALARSLGKTWLDKIEIDCAAPRVAAAGADPIGELRGLMEAEVADSLAFREALRGIAADLRGHLPADLREDLFGADGEGFDEALKAIAREGAEDVLARLRAAEAGAPT